MATLAEKLIGKLKDFIAKVKAYFDGLTTNTKAEAALLKEMRDGGLHYLERIGEAYDKAATAAVENYQGAETRNEGKAQKEQLAIREAFSDEIDQWAKDGKPEGVRFTLGSTGPVLQGLGAIESDIYMEGDKISTILREHPEMTLAEIKKIPQILEDPALVLKSKGSSARGRNTRLVVFGSAKAANGKPVMSVLDLRPRENGFVLEDMQKVNSAYAKKNPGNFLTSSEVLYADKKRTIPLLRSSGLTIASRQLLRNGYIGSITYAGQNVNIKGVPFSSVVGEGDVQYSFSGARAKTADRAALQKAIEMQKQQKTNEEIRKETGWFVGMDGKWRFEIDDSGMKYDLLGERLGRDSKTALRDYNSAFLKLTERGLTDTQRADLAEYIKKANKGSFDDRLYQKLSKALGGDFETFAAALEAKRESRYHPDGKTLEDYISHDALFKAYPELRDVKVVFEKTDRGENGRYNSKTKTIYISDKLRNAPEGTLLHEIQHTIQEIEEFSPGASPEYWAAKDYESGDKISERLQKQYDSIVNHLSKENQNRYIRYMELERELERLFLADENSEDGKKYTKLEAEQDALYEELYPNKWFQKLLDLDRRIGDQGAEYYWLYRNTAGEIEARDSDARRALTADQRKEKAPNLGGPDTVFADRDTKFSLRDSVEDAKIIHTSTADYWSDQSYRGTEKASPMSEWGHAMFMDDPGMIIAYGENRYSVFHEDLTSVDDLKEKIARLWEEDKEAGRLPAWYMEEISGEDAAESFDPKDIVDSAEAWDNGDMMQWYFSHPELFEDIPGIKTADGAIVWDESIIYKTDYDEDSSVMGTVSHEQRLKEGKRQQGDTQFSIREIDGEAMPVLDTQKDTRDYKVAEAYLKTLVDTEHPFATILTDAQPVYIGKDLPGEYKSSEYTKTLRKAIRDVKMQAATNLDEMLLLAENGEWQENIKEKHKTDAKNGWYRYSTQFAVPVLDMKKSVDHYTVYSGTLLIRNDADGKSYLYDLLDIKKEKVISSTSFSAQGRSVVFEPKPSQAQYTQNQTESQAQIRSSTLSDRDVLRIAAQMAKNSESRSLTDADRLAPLDFSCHAAKHLIQTHFIQIEAVSVLQRILPRFLFRISIFNHQRHFTGKYTNSEQCSICGNEKFFPAKINRAIFCREGNFHFG